MDEAVQHSLPFDDPEADRQTSGLDVHRCRPGDALATLATVIDDAKGGDRLAPVTVIVSTNIAGVMARRALGRQGGVLGVDVITLGRVAELIAGPTLAAAGRHPVSDPILDVTITDVLAEQPGMFAAVAHHPTTVTALRQTHQELRLAGSEGRRALAARGRRGAEVVRVSSAVTTRLRRRWYDEADVFEQATRLLDDAAPAGLRHLIVHLPQRFDAMSGAFARRLTDLVPTSVVAAMTGDPSADEGVHAAIADLGGRSAAPTPAHAPRCAPARVTTTTDADDEVRVAVRALVDAARGELTGVPVPFERMGVFWPAHVPYARLVEHHLAVDGLPWNGRGGITVNERIAPRLLLDLLDVDRRRLRRSDLFDLLADVPVRDADGRRRPTAEWLRVARATGISEGTDWQRLGSIDDESRWSGPATELAEFVDDLRARLGRPSDTRTWREWSEWCEAQLVHWLGPRAEIRLGDADYRAWEATMSILDRLRSLDHVAEPPNRRRFRSVLDAELEQVSVREGRIGTGVVTGSLASAPGLDLDVVIVLGGSDGTLPPPPRSDALLSDDDRLTAGLLAADERARQLHHALRSVVDSAHTLVTVPRGDLRTTATLTPSRWIEFPSAGSDRLSEVDSSTAGLAALERPPGERERRLRDRLRRGPVDPVDGVLARGLAMQRARSSDRFTEYDGDLTSVELPRLGDRPVSPTQLQVWATCPHTYFVRYLLGVRPIEEVDRDISIRALDSGDLLHRAVDLLHRDVLAGRLPQPTAGWDDDHRRALLAHFDTVADDTERRGRTGRPATWFGDRARLRADVLGWLARDGDLAAARGTTILRSEFDFGAIDRRRPDPEADPPTPVDLELGDGRRLAVFGSADRIDRWRDGTVVITDHKTGSDRYRQLDATDPTLGATVFQLPAYAAAAATITDADGPVRAEYSMFEKGAYARRGFTFTDEVWERIGAALSSVVDGIETGWFPQLPEAPGWRLFNSCLQCDPDGIGTDDAWARWLAKRGDPRSARWFADTADDEQAAAT